MRYLPAITRHCEHQHLAMGSWLFLAPIEHQGQFLEAGHKVWTRGHQVDASEQKPAELCTLDLSASKQHVQNLVQLAVKVNKNYLLILNNTQFYGYRWKQGQSWPWFDKTLPAFLIKSCSLICLLVF